MNIYINGRFLSQNKTGVQRFAGEIVRELDMISPAHGLQPILLTPRNLVEAPVYTNTKIRRTGRLSGHVWEQLELPAHCHDGLLVNLGNTGPLLLSRQVVVIHDLAIFRYPQAFSPIFRNWYRVLFRRLVSGDCRILTVSNFSRREIITLLNVPPQNVSILGEGHEHILRTPADRSILSRYNLSDKPYILSVSSRNPYKNFSTVIKAYHSLDTKHFDLVIVGGGNEKIFAQSNEPDSDKVKFIGHINDAGLRCLYEHARAFVFPTLYEGFGLPPLEAMACGCPVITSNRASLPEVCGDAAIYFDPENYKELARQISKALEDDALFNLLQEKGRRQAEKHTWHQSAQRMCKYIRETIPKKTK